MKNLFWGDNSWKKSLLAFFCFAEIFLWRIFFGKFFLIGEILKIEKKFAGFYRKNYKNSEKFSNTRQNLNVCRKLKFLSVKKCLFNREKNLLNFFNNFFLFFGRLWQKKFENTEIFIWNNLEASEQLFSRSYDFW